jgi:hypothetical protein
LYLDIHSHASNAPFELTNAKATTAAQDATIQLSAAKAKELGVTNGDAVVLIGRRRHAAYATVNIAKDTKKSVCSIGQNMAQNLRLRQDDKVKVVALDKSFEEESASERSGDLLLLQKQPASIQSVTLSPVEDSLAGLVASEGGDEIADEELQRRFLTPYLEQREGGLLKQGHLLVLRDDNGKRLEFYVSQIDLEGDAAPAEKPEASAIEGSCLYNSIVFAFVATLCLTRKNASLSSLVIHHSSGRVHPSVRSNGCRDRGCSRQFHSPRGLWIGLRFRRWYGQDDSAHARTSRATAALSGTVDDSRCAVTKGCLAARSTRLW